MKKLFESISSVLMALTGKLVRFLQRVEKGFTLSRRQQFVATTIALTFLLILTQVASADYRYGLVISLSITTYLLSAFSLREDLKGIEWFTLLMLPALYSAAVGLFYFPLPVRWLTRIPVALLYAIGLYAILLTENIYNVAANRTIALLRAAHSIGFLLSFVTYFMLTQTIFAFRFGPFLNAALVSVLSFILIFQALWSMELEEKASGRVVAISIALSVVMTEITGIISFFPAQPIMNALFISALYYSLVGMAQQYMGDKMYKKTVLEFFIVSLFILLVYFFTINWQG
jgi:hypothetical protein